MKRSSLLSNILQQLLKPLSILIEMLSTLDSLKLNRPNRRALLILVLSHTSRHTRNRALHTLLRTIPNQLAIKLIRRRRPGKVPRLLHQRLLRSDERRQPFREVHTRIDLCEADVSERIAGHGLAVGLQLGNDFAHAGALAQKDVDAPHLVHNLLKTLALGGNIESEFRNPNGVNVTRFLRGGESRPDEFGGLDGGAVFSGRGGGEISRVASHDLVDDEHAGVGGAFADDVFEEDGSLFGGGVGAEGLDDGEDVVVDGFGHADYDHLAAVFVKDVLGEYGSLGVGVVAADGVDNADFVADELLGCSFEGGLAIFDEAAGNAVFDVGELDTRVSNRTSSDLMQTRTIIINIR
mmetsp:Transcript_7862/g.13692  ORF Transcript_7862/g.13692 Transcript_7862/m.13692 type:complete len:351 (-) Transcript_7862:243-1295(-)